MTQEDKMLLIKDLLSRLPYGVHVQHISGVSCILHNISISIHHKYDENSNICNVICYIDLFRDGGSIAIEQFKPYLFPLSSMTEEQEKEYNNLNCYELGCFPHSEEALDYLTKNHFDYRHLIEKGLAIDATGLNIY